MLTDTPHFAPRHMAEAYLASRDWTETAVNTWTSPDGDHVASFEDFCGSVVDVCIRGVVQ